MSTWLSAGLLSTLVAALGLLATSLFRLDNKIDALGSHLTGRLDASTGRLDALTGRLDGLTGRLDALGTRMDARFDRMDERLSRIELRLVEHLHSSH